MIILKSAPEIEKMRRAGRIVAKAIRELSESIVPGRTTTADLDDLARDVIEKEGGIPSFLNYRGYPAAACISPNEVVVHGIPDETLLAEGDIVDIDLGVEVGGYHADSAWTFPVGEISEENKRLLNVTRECLFQGIAKARPGNRIGDISATVQRYAESHGYGVIRDLVGHGIGTTVHEEPSVPNYGKPGRGPVLKEGMTICIEPMIARGTWRVKTLKDGWTVVTADGKNCAHFEHTVAITKDGAEILTIE